MNRSSWRRIIANGLVLGVVAAVLAGPALQARADNVRAAQWYLGFLRVDEAHRYSEGTGVTVGLVDDGVDVTHPDLIGGIVPGADTFPGGTGDGTNPADEHGTRMAGLIAGHGHGPGNNQGLMGIAPKAMVLTIRDGINRFGSGGNIAGVAWATAHGAKVISLSWGGPGSPELRKVIDDAIAHDIVVVAAVGNKPENVYVDYPAAYPGVLAVAGVDEQGNHAAFSVTGREVILAAPGANIVTTGLNHGYGRSSGTSDSAAIVTGAAALVRAKFPNLSATEVIHRLTATAIDKGPPGRDNEYGFGIVNLVGALTADVPPSVASPSATQPSSAATGRDPEGSAYALAPLAVAAGVVLLAGLAILIAVRNRRPRT